MSNSASRSRELKQDRPSVLARDRAARRRERERTEVLAFPRIEWREDQIKIAKAFHLLPEEYPWEQSDYQEAFERAFEILGNLYRLAPALGAVMETQGYATSTLPKESDE